ncbi:MAG: hypothetical protein WDW38_007876 [Sanguina aurantia]
MRALILTERASATICWTSNRRPCAAVGLGHTQFKSLHPITDDDFPPALPPDFPELPPAACQCARPPAPTATSSTFLHGCATHDHPFIGLPRTVAHQRRTVTTRDGGVNRRPSPRRVPAYQTPYRHTARSAVACACLPHPSSLSPPHPPLHDPSLGPLAPRTLYRYRTVKGLQDLTAPRPDKPSKYLRSTGPVVTVLQDFTPPALATLMGCLTQLGGNSGGDLESNSGGGSGACAEAVAGRLLPAVALHLLASGSRADAGGAKGGELRQVLGACRAARYRNPELLGTLLVGAHLDAHSPQELLALARDCAFHGLDDAPLLRRIARVLLPRADELSLAERAQLAYVCAKGEYHDAALVQPLLELLSAQPATLQSLPFKAVSQLLYAASRLPGPHTPPLLHPLQTLMTALTVSGSQSPARPADGEVAPAAAARLLTMLLGWEGHDKVAVGKFAGQLQPKMGELQPHRAAALRAAALKAGLHVKL